MAILEQYRVPAGAVRTTPKPPVDVPALVPELKGLTKVTMRLHPRYGDEPKPDESKLGGRFLWPADEPWPVDAKTELPLVPVLQLRAEDAPPNFAFQPGTDLLQLLWCPRAELRPVIAWRKRAAVTGDLAPYPTTDRANMDFVPVPCRVFPERVTEFPGYSILPGVVKGKVDAVKGLGRQAYETLGSVAAGTKVGGYPPVESDVTPSCTTCGWGMDFLLRVAGQEWNREGAPRWKPVEEAGGKEDAGFQSAAGLTFEGGGAALLFVCRRCEAWPIGFRIV